MYRIKRVSETIGWTGNVANDKIKLTNNGTPDKGSMYQADTINDIRIGNVMDILHDNEEEINQHFGTIDDIYDLVTSVDSELVPHTPSSDLNDLEINTPTKYTSYPYGFANAPLAFKDAGQWPYIGENLNVNYLQWVNTIYELLVNQYYIYKNSDNTTFDINLNKYNRLTKSNVEILSTLHTYFNDTCDKKFVYDRNADKFIIKLNNIKNKESILSSIYTMLKTKIQIDNNNILKLNKFKQRIKEDEFNVIFKDNIFNNISSEWTKFMSLVDLCRNVDLYINKIQSDVDNINIKSKYDLNEFITNSMIYRKFLELSMFDIHTFIGDFTYNISKDNLLKLCKIFNIHNEGDIKGTLLSELCNFYFGDDYKYDYTQLIKHKAHEFKSKFNEFKFKCNEINITR